MNYLFLFLSLFVNAQSFSIIVNNQSNKNDTLHYTDKAKPYLLEVFEKKWVLHKGVNKLELPTYKDAVYSLRIPNKNKKNGEKSYKILPQDKEVFTIDIDKTDRFSLKSNLTDAYPLLEKAPNLYRESLEVLHNLRDRYPGPEILQLTAQRIFKQRMSYYNTLLKTKKLPQYLYDYYNSDHSELILYDVYSCYPSWENIDKGLKTAALNLYTLFSKNIKHYQGFKDRDYKETICRMVYQKHLDLDLPKNTITDWEKFPYKEHYVYFSPEELEVEIGNDLHYGLRNPAYNGSVSDRLYKLLVQTFPKSLYITLYKEHYSKQKN